MPASSNPAPSAQTQYIQQLTTLSDADLQQERQRCVTTSDIDCLNLVTMELVNRMSQLQLQVATMAQQVAQTTVVAQQVQASAPNVFAQKTIKVERPQNYDGAPSKLSNFLFTVGQYMDTTGLTDDIHRCQFAATLLRGRALTWWRTWCDRIPNLQTTLGFPLFSIELEKAFRDVDHVDRLRRRLAALKQITSVSKYIDEFRTIIIELGSAKPDDDTVLFQFINGLKPAVQLQVRMARPQDIVQAETAAEQTDSAIFLATRGGHVQQSRPQRPNRPSHVPMDLGAMQQLPPKRPNVTCHRCGKQGHVRKDCRVRLGPNQGPQGNWNQQKVQFADANAAATSAQLPPPPPCRNQSKN